MRSAARTTIRLLESCIRVAQAHAKLMFRNEVVLQDAIVAVMLIESSMHTESTLGIDSVLHSTFPADPDAEYRTQEAVILRRLGLHNDLGGAASVPPPLSPPRPRPPTTSEGGNVTFSVDARPYVPGATGTAPREAPPQPRPSAVLRSSQPPPQPHRTDTSAHISSDAEAPHEPRQPVQSSAFVIHGDDESDDDEESLPPEANGSRYPGTSQPTPRPRPNHVPPARPASLPSAGRVLSQSRPHVPVVTQTPSTAPRHSQGTVLNQPRGPVGIGNHERPMTQFAVASVGPSPPSRPAANAGQAHESSFTHFSQGVASQSAGPPARPAPPVSSSFHSQSRPVGPLLVPQFRAPPPFHSRPSAEAPARPMPLMPMTPRPTVGPGPRLGPSTPTSSFAPHGPPSSFQTRPQGFPVPSGSARPSGHSWPQQGQKRPHPDSSPPPEPTVRSYRERGGRFDDLP